MDVITLYHQGGIAVEINQQLVWQLQEAQKNAAGVSQALRKSPSAATTDLSRSTAVDLQSERSNMCKQLLT
jgi:hypothetical protein